MDNVKNDAYYIKKMLTDIKFIIDKTKGITLQGLKEDEVLCDSALFRLIQISENSVKVSQEFRDEHKDIPWQAIKGMRNRIVHEYGEVNLGIVYDTVSISIPELCKRLEELI